MRDLEYAKGFWNPYVAGIALGLVLLLTFYLMGTGLGASGAVARASAVIAHEVAPTAVEQNPYYKEFYKPGGKHPLVNWMVIEVVGVFIGGLIAVLTARQIPARRWQRSHCECRLAIGHGLRRRDNWRHRDSFCSGVYQRPSTERRSNNGGG